MQRVDGQVPELNIKSDNRPSISCALGRGLARAPAQLTPYLGPFPIDEHQARVRSFVSVVQIYPLVVFSDVQHVFCTRAHAPAHTMHYIIRISTAK